MKLRIVLAAGAAVLAFGVAPSLASAWPTDTSSPGTPNSCIARNQGDWNACNVGNSGRGDLPFKLIPDTPNSCIKRRPSSQTWAVAGRVEQRQQKPSGRVPGVGATVCVGVADVVDETLDKAGDLVHCRRRRRDSPRPGRRELFGTAHCGAEFGEQPRVARRGQGREQWLLLLDMSGERHPDADPQRRQPFCGEIGLLELFQLLLAGAVVREPRVRQRDPVCDVLSDGRVEVLLFGDEVTDQLHDELLTDGGAIVGVTSRGRVIELGRDRVVVAAQPVQH
jgi:hypothetical protein